MFKKIISLVPVFFGLAIAFVIGYGLGSTNEYSYNANYSGAASALIAASVKQLENGRVADVLTEWKGLKENFHTSYERKGNFRALATEAAERLNKLSSAGVPANIPAN